MKPANGELCEYEFAAAVWEEARGVPCRPPPPIIFKGVLNLGGRLGVEGV